MDNYDNHLDDAVNVENVKRGFAAKEQCLRCDINEVDEFDDLCADCEEEIEREAFRS